MMSSIPQNEIADYKSIPPHIIPIPILQPSQIPPKIPVRVKPPKPIIHVSDFQANSKGIFQYNAIIPCMAKCFMLPFPYLCVGCCMANTITSIFNDKTATITIKWYPGYYFFLGGKVVIPYTEVANVMADVEMSGNYVVTLVTKSGSYIKLSNSAKLASLKADVLGLHKFLFGRHNPAAYTSASVMNGEVYFPHIKEQKYSSNETKQQSARRSMFLFGKTVNLDIVPHQSSGIIPVAPPSYNESQEVIGTIDKSYSTEDARFSILKPIDSATTLPSAPPPEP